jgi:hypothetical protein
VSKLRTLSGRFLEGDGGVPVLQTGPMPHQVILIKLVPAVAVSTLNGAFPLNVA